MKWYKKLFAPQSFKLTDYRGQIIMVGGRPVNFINNMTVRVSLPDADKDNSDGN